MSFFGKIITSLFGGDKKEKDIKELTPYIKKINEEYDKLQHISHDELRSKTLFFKEQVQIYISGLNQEIAAARQRAASPEVSPEEKEAIFKQVDVLNKQRNEKIEEVLMQLLPQAFAVVKQTARRFKENTSLSVRATDLDRQLAAIRPHIIIEGDTAHYKNAWMAAGNLITWDMLHYDVQLIGGVVLHQGKISEMATGEGKTLVATLPAYLNAIAGEGVHIVTVNNYLSFRDSEWMGGLFNFLGLTVDCIDRHQPNSEARRRAYAADITYGTNNEFGFDYLRDNMCRQPGELVQKKHHYAMVDEVDSVLIDDARTPLIISGPVEQGDRHEFDQLKPRIEKLVEAQRRLVTQCLSEAKQLIAEGKTDEQSGGLMLFRAYRGLPKNGALIKFLGEAGMKVLLQKTENYFLQEQQKKMPIADRELYFTIDERNNSVDLTEKGIELITYAGEDPSFFVLPDMGSELADLERNTELSSEEKIASKDQIVNNYAIKSERIHSVQQLLKAYALFEKDVEYVVMDGKVKIVDEQTGRILEGRRYSDGLHQAIEAKENVTIEAATQTYATISLQNYFRMYHKLAGMTGTAETEAQEFWDIYKLDCVVIPTNRKISRNDKDDLVYRTKKEKYAAVIDEIVRLQDAGRPVLVGTTAVDVSELLSRMLTMKNIKHNVLNAKQHAREAEIVAEAGIAGTVTIATNMAGRGTDIKLGAGVKETGGLAIIGTERHDSRRVDRQLRGRAGRQGDPGTSQFYVSLDDTLMRLFGSERIANVMDKMGYKEGEVIQHSMITKSIERAQKKVEENNFGVRKRLLEYDDVMNSQRTVIYTRRRNALMGERLQVDLYNMFYELATDLVNTHLPAADFENFNIDVLRFFSLDTEITESEFKSTRKPEVLIDKLYHEALALYKRKSQHIAQTVFPFIQNVFSTPNHTIQNLVFPFTDGKHAMQITTTLKDAFDTQGAAAWAALEKSASLAFIDEAWKEHLRQMDELKQAVQMAVHEQKDPLLIYKLEAFQLFKQMVQQVNREVAAFLFRAGLMVQQETPETVVATEVTSSLEGTHPRQLNEGSNNTQLRTSRSEVGDELADSADASQQQRTRPSMPPPAPVRVGPKIGRNDPCPCGSGKKYKNCHGQQSEQ